MIQVLKIIKLTIKYAGLVVVIVEILEFASEKLTNIDLKSKEKKEETTAN